MANSRLSELVRVVEVSRLGGELACDGDGRLAYGPHGGTFRARRKAYVVDEQGADWLCAAVAPGREFGVADDLAAVGFRTFCPHAVRVHFRARDRNAPREKRKRRERDVPVFGNYVFVGTPCGEGMRLVKRSHSHILAVLDEGRYFVPRAFIAEATKLWMAGTWDMRIREGVRFKRGETVRVKSGVFEGLNAVIERMPSQSRAVVSTALFGRMVQATVDSAALEPIYANHREPAVVDS